MTIFTFTSEKLTVLSFLCLIMEELWKAKHTAEYFMYCLWTGRTCIFITKINFPISKVLFLLGARKILFNMSRTFLFYLFCVLCSGTCVLPPHQILRFLSSFSTPASQSVWNMCIHTRLPGNAECPLRKHWQSWR